MRRKDRGQFIGALAGRNHIPFRSRDLDGEEAEDVVSTCSIPRKPAVIFGKAHVIADPTPRKIARLFGLDLDLDDERVHDVLIVGGGPGGIAAAVYAGARAVGARAIMVATGVQYRRLPLPRLEELEGAGIYYAAIEIEACFCKSTDMVIIGEGNSAGQAAMFLSRHANGVHLLVRGDSLADSMSNYLSDRLKADNKICIRHGTQVAGSVKRVASAVGEGSVVISKVWEHVM